MPLDRALLAADNQLELRAEGRLDMDHWFQIGIDTGATTRGSSFSTDGGKTFSSDDLSADLKAQQGEYLIRIVDQRPGGAELDPANLAQCPGFEQVKVPHSETRLTVAPAENVAVWMAGKQPSPALAISPDGPPVAVTGAAREGGVVYTVPRVGIYTILLLGAPPALQAVRDRQQPVWDLPPVTEPLRVTAPGWDAYDEGFTLETEAAHTGSHCVSCANADDQAIRGLVQVIEVDQKEARPLTLTAWSRAEGVSGTPNGDYSLYVDATCADGSVYHGHNTPFAVGTHDWQEVTLRLESPKPLKSMRVYLLFRRHAGRVWFDDVRVSGER
ncbi:MAG: hypothetical protein HYU66_17825 [Armatimonadetes bacterium]|nr:hypothetical protein [Armatimonadota bacterium]